jgi:hypothetical protein
MLRERGPSRNAGKQGVKTVLAGFMRFYAVVPHKKNLLDIERNFAGDEPIHKRLFPGHAHAHAPLPRRRCGWQRFHRRFFSGGLQHD